MLINDMIFHSGNEKEKLISKQINEKVDNTFKNLIKTQYSNEKYAPLTKLGTVSKFNKKTYPYLNTQFKTTFSKVSPYSKIGGIYIRSYYNVKLVDTLLKYLTVKTVSKSTHGEYEYIKFEFNENALSCILYHVISMIIASTGRLLGCQLYAAYLMAIIEFFHVNDIDWSFAKSYIYQYAKTTNHEDLEPYIQELKNSKKICDVKRTSIKKGKPHSRKIRVSDKEVSKLMEAGLSQTKIKEQLSIKYGCSPKTIQRAMNSFGLTRSYSK